MKHEDDLPYDITCTSYDELYQEEQYSKYSYIVVGEGIVPKDTIIDLGAGTGLFYKFIFIHKKTEEEPANIRYIGIDPSNGMLSMFKTKLSQLKTRYNCLLIQAYGEYMPIRDGVIKLIYSFTVINNVVDKRKFINEALSKLSKDGILVVTYLRKDPRSKDIENLIDFFCKMDNIHCELKKCNSIECFTVLRKLSKINRS